MMSFSDVESALKTTKPRVSFLSRSSTTLFDLETVDFCFYTLDALFHLVNIALSTPPSPTCAWFPVEYAPVNNFFFFTQSKLFLEFA